MCIRDRPKAALKDFRVKSTLDDSYKNGIFSLNVDLRNHEKSATNLTLVYELLDAQGKVISTEEKTAYIPVSYTHLDVYKRQVKPTVGI